MPICEIVKKVAAKSGACVRSVYRVLREYKANMNVQNQEQIKIAIIYSIYMILTKMLLGERYINIFLETSYPPLLIKCLEMCMPTFKRTTFNKY